MRTMGRPPRGLPRSGQGADLAGQSRLVARRSVAVDDPLGEGAVDRRQGAVESLAGRVRVLTIDEDAEPAELSAQTASTGPVDGVAPEILASVLDGRLDACHGNPSWVNSAILEPEPPQAIARRAGLIGPGKGGEDVLQLDDRLGGPLQFEEREPLLQIGPRGARA